MASVFRPVIAAAMVAGLACPLAGAQAWEMSGTKRLAMHTDDGKTLDIGTVDFTPAGDRVAFTVNLDVKRFKDFFLSMREFKCLESPKEVQCHVRYPYANPMTVTAGDLSWLEHALLFLYKAPTQFGAKLSNGLYYKMAVTGDGIVGVPQSIDLNQIAAPPDDLAVPPYGPSERVALEVENRWIRSLSIR